MAESKWVTTRNLLIGIAVIQIVQTIALVFMLSVGGVVIFGHLTDINESIGALSEMITLTRSGVGYVMETARANDYDMKATLEHLMPMNQEALEELLGQFGAGTTGAARLVETLDRLDFFGAVQPLVATLGSALSTPEARTVAITLSSMWNHAMRDHEFRMYVADEARDGFLAAVNMTKSFAKENAASVFTRFTEVADLMMERVESNGVQITVGGHGPA